ncbi:TBC1 domain family member 5 [Bombyx mandarina]|uniref:TBC1 domain family member 5 n=1 Tax=Bombyx mandarina TaxID=7092 RepID=A0A6J2K1N7_BOMMA|nr:TBC1 domain family member 5 [Bombyx mandarina]
MDQNSAKTASLPNNGTEGIDFDLEQPLWCLEELQKAAIEHRLLRPRSLAWAIMLNALPPPNADIVSRLKCHRNFYDDLKVKLSMDPRAVIGDDPLSQNDKSAWRQHFCDNELKTVILQDVVRTFPDELYFREKDVQDLMVRVLFYWARSHSHVGYRQGMHEILAPLLFELYLDRKFAPRAISDKLKIILDEDYLEHDSHMLFSTVMQGLERFYVTGDVVPSPSGRMPSSRMIHNPNEVVRYLEKVKEDYLFPLDPELATHLTNFNISLELFGIRWLRLLFGREFPRAQLAPLWGFLFAQGPALPRLHYVVVAALLAARASLLDNDPGAVLSALMRPSHASAAHVCALALHLWRPLEHPRPPPPPPPRAADSHPAEPTRERRETWNIEVVGSEAVSSGSESEGVAEGGDVSRSLAALAVLRAHLPPAAAALAAALPRPPPDALPHLRRILHLAALLQCKNHTLIDVETALEAAEGQQPTDNIGRKQLVPVTAIAVKNKPNKQNFGPLNKVKEVQLKVFHQVECDRAGDLPCLDPLRLRTE